MRHALIVAVVIASASCTPGPDAPDGGSSGDGRPCSSQLDCTPATSLKQTCEGGWCSGPLGETDLVTLFIDRRGNSAIGEVGTYRALVVGERAPDGDVVTCAEIMAADLNDLKDPARFNLLSNPNDASNCSIFCGNNLITTATFLDRPGRLLYVELYEKDFGQERIGRGCIENATPTLFRPQQDKDGSYVTVETQ